MRAWITASASRLAGGQGPVWGVTPAWEARLGQVSGEGLRCAFAFAPAFVRGFAESEATSRRWLVRAALRMALGVGLASAGALLLHGAGLVGPAGRAVVCLGASGAGKTTMVRRLAGWPVLGDDVVAVWRAAGVWHAGWTPLRGREGTASTPGDAPLAALLRLRPSAAALEVRPLDRAAALTELMQRACLDADPAVPRAVLARVLETSHALATEAPAWELASSLDHDVCAAVADLAEGRGHGHV
jgi:hypothetical protein